ncbi:MAG: flagella basal body P-ring formation protein FlgA [Sphingomonadaceae bacterium]
MTTLSAAALADLDAVDRQVAAFTGAEIGAEGGAVLPIDRRLRLKRCASSLALSWRTSRHDTVVVQCGDAGGWRLFVPVKARVVASAPAQKLPPAVNRGEAVTIAVEGAGFSVSRQGEAMDAGPVGAWIRVRPASESRTPAQPLRARIVRPGLVAVSLR